MSLPLKKRRTEPAPVPQPPAAERPRAVDPAPLACPPGTTRAVLDGLRAQGTVQIVPARPARRMARPERVRIVPMRIKLPADFDRVVLAAPATLDERLAARRPGVRQARNGGGTVKFETLRNAYRTLGSLILAVPSDMQFEHWSIYSGEIDAMFMGYGLTNDEARAQLRSLADLLVFTYSEKPHQDTRLKLSVSGRIGDVPVEFWWLTNPEPVVEADAGSVDDGDAVNDPDVLSETPLAVAFGAALPAPVEDDDTAGGAL